MTNPYYMKPEREGACYKDVWKIYNMLPDNTHFTLEFYRRSAPDDPIRSIGFLKCGNPLESMTVEDHTDQMKAAFREFGYDGYRCLLMEWRRGFGNSVIVKVVLDE